MVNKKFSPKAELFDTQETLFLLTEFEEPKPKETKD